MSSFFTFTCAVIYILHIYALINAPLRTDSTRVPRGRIQTFFGGCNDAGKADERFSAGYIKLYIFNKNYYNYGSIN